MVDRAWCELHQVHVVDKLPDRCPLGESNPFETIRVLRAIAWRELGKLAHADHGEATRLLNRADLCMECIGRNLTNSTIQRLRKAGAV